jgi:hypothetical protein
LATVGPEIEYPGFPPLLGPIVAPTIVGVASLVMQSGPIGRR